MVALVLQAIALWKEKHPRQAREVYQQAAKVDPRVGQADELCRLILCGSSDMGLVEDFLRKNRWALQPSNDP